MTEADIRRQDEIERLKDVIEGLQAEIFELRDQNADLRRQLAETYPAYMVDELRAENAELETTVAELCNQIAELKAAVDPAKLYTLHQLSVEINNDWKAKTPGPFDRLGDDISPLPDHTDFCGITGTRKPSFLED